MERHNPPVAPSRSFSKQTSLLEDEDTEEPLVCDERGLGLVPVTPELSSPHPPSLPVTPPSPSPAVSPSSPAVSTPASSSSPSHLPSSSPNSGSSSNILTCTQGPGPGGGGSVSPPSVCGMAVGQGPTAPPSGVMGGSCRSKSLELPSQRSSDSEKDAPSNSIARHRHPGAKTKLLQRSHAMREDTSPPPDIMEVSGASHLPGGHICPSNSLTVGPSMPSMPNRRRLRQQGSGSFEGSRSFEGSTPCLSRDSSMEYTDSSGVDLLQFIIQTLHKNQKDRMMLIKIEKDLTSLVRDSKRVHHKFPQMSSYQRMLVHRVAAFFGLEHNVDIGGTAVIVNKTPHTRLPETRFKDYIRDELLPPDEPRRSILRRDFSSFEDSTHYKSSDRHLGNESRRSKSFEEREEEYEKSFCNMDDSRFHDPRHHDLRRNSHEDRWQDPRHWTFVENESHRKHYDNHRLRSGRIPKVESFESHDFLNPKSLRPPVFKSHSFGGYSGGVTVLSRGDSVASNPPPLSRCGKQDSTGSRYSDHSSSSGYKTQRQDTSSTNVSNTLSTTPSPTAGQHQHPAFGQHGGVWGTNEGETQPVMWAVTDIEAVPPGALLINPQSGQPYVNPDGSAYRYDPTNPLPVGKATACSPKMSSMNSRDKGKGYLDSAAENVAEAAEDSSSERQSSIPDTLQAPSIGEPCEYDDGSDGAASKGSVDVCTLKDSRKSGNRRSVDDEEHSQHSDSLSSHFFQSGHHHSEGRPFSHDSMSDVSGQLRSLSLSGSGNGGDGSLPDVVSPPSASASVPQGYMMSRQQYPQTVYYMPTGNVPTGGIKYIYPPYPVAPMATHVQGATAGVQPPTAPATALGHHSTPVLHSLPPVGSMPSLTPMPQAMGVSAPPAGDSNVPLPTNYLPGNYTVVAYPSSGLLSNVASTGTGHESRGTTYYCQLPGPAALAPPNAAAGTASNPVGASVPVTSLQQYAITPTSTATTTFPIGQLSYFTASGMNSNGMYPSNGMQGYSGGIYGAPAQTPQPPVAYRAPSPPATPCTQAVGMPLNFSASGGSSGIPPTGVPGQYFVLPPHQPPTPTTSQAAAAPPPHPPPQLFTTFFRPPVQPIWPEVPEAAFDQGPPS